MNKLGVVSTVDNDKRQARVNFEDLDNQVSFNFSIAAHIQALTVGQKVLVSFYGVNFTDGIIVAII